MSSALEAVQAAVAAAIAAVNQGTKEATLSLQLYELLELDQEPSEQAIRDLIAQGANPNFRLWPKSERAPMHVAAEQGYANALRVMEECGGDVNLESGAWKTPLIYVAQYNQPKAVEALLELGANVMHCNDVGQHVLHFAANYAAIEVLKLLLADPAKALLNRSCKKLETPLLWATRHRPANEEETSKGLETIQLLLEAGADATLVDKDGMSPLMEAAKGNLKGAVELLLPHEPDINRRSMDGGHALYYAASRGRYAQVKQLLEAGSDVHLRDKIYGDDALMGLINKPATQPDPEHNDEIIRLLGRWGADVNRPNHEGIRPLVLALQKQEPVTVLQALLGLGARLPADDEKYPVAVACRKRAQARFDATIGATPPDVSELKPADLILFSNLGQFEKAVRSSAWQGREAQLQALLSELPPALVEEAVRYSTSQPKPLVSDWSHEMAASQGRGYG